MLLLFTSSVCFLSLLPVVYSQINSTFWVQTAIYSANSIQTNNATVQAQFETSLMTAYTQAYTLQAASSSTVGRRKRLATSTLTNSLQLQLVNITINSSNTAVYYLTYYVLFSGSPFAATTVCSTLNLLNVQQMALTLGYLVVTECSVYLQTATTTSDAQYWVLATCVGVLCGVVLVVSVILIGVCACADSSCTDDRKASSDGVFAPKNSAVYLDEVEASLIEEELTDNERRKVADQLLRTASTSRNAVSGKSYKLPEVENSATIAQKVADELKPQLETMMAEQKSDLEKKVVHEVRNGVRRMEKRQKKQLDEMSRTQRELLEANSNGLFYLNPDDGDGNGKLEGEVNDAVELVEFEDEAVNVRKRQVQNETAKTAEEHDDGAKSVTQQETPLNDTNVADADVNTLAETADVLQMEADRTVGGDENPEPLPLPLPPRTHGARKRTEPKRFSSELRVNGGNGSYIKHLEETGRRPGGPLPASKDAVDVATVGLAMDRDSSSLRATLASL